MKGHCYRRPNQPDKAIEVYEETLETIRASGLRNFTMRFYPTTVYLSLGRAYMARGENANALEAFEKCLAECESWAGPEDWPYKEALEAIEVLRKP